MPKIAFFVGGYPPAYLGGGPIRTAHAMATSIHKRYRVLVLTSDRDVGERETLSGIVPNQWTETPEATVYYATLHRPIRFARSLAAVRRQQPDIVYLNSFFSPRMSILPQILHALGLFGRSGLIVAPRGELSPGALDIKRAKKLAFLNVYRVVGLHRRPVWHVSTPLEESEVGNVLPGVSAIVRENETLLPPHATEPTSRQPGVLQLLFVSRIVPKKGLDTAIAALGQLPPGLPRRTVLRIIGSEEDPEYAQICRDLASSLPEGVHVEFLGPRKHEHIRAEFAASDAFVFPTHSENFGQVIAESLSSSCPVICSASTPWTKVLVGGGGAALPSRDPAEWSRQILELVLAADSDLLRRKSAAGAAYEAWRSAQQGPSVFDLYLRDDRHSSPR